jgi:hypothetical protein
MPMPMQAPPAAAAAIVAARNRGYEGLEASTRRRVYSGNYSVHSILLQARGAPRGHRRRIYPPLAQALTATLVEGSRSRRGGESRELAVVAGRVDGCGGGGSEKAESCSAPKESRHQQTVCLHSGGTRF